MASIIGSALAQISNTRPRGPKSPVPFTGRNPQSSFFARRNSAPSETELSATDRVAILYSVVNRISTAVAATEWRLYRKPNKPLKQISGSTMDDAREQVFQHAALDVWNQPNPFQNGHEWREAAQQHLELTGESWSVIAKRPRMSIPAELWQVRPDRMDVVPDRQKFLKGYIFTTADGDKVPLMPDEVILNKTPNPVDPYRGLGPVQSLLVDLDATVYSAQWNRNFFLNNAMPGGIIQIDRRLSDEEFDELAMRWNEQHRGTSKAHRIAILEQGTYIPANYTIKDMAFGDLRMLNRNTIMEAYGISNSTLGISDGVNYAAAKAADTQFAKLITVPRLERWKHMLNHVFLPMFGSTGQDVMFDYVSPVPQDDDAINSERTSKTQAAVALVQVGFDPAVTLEVLGLPPIPWHQPPMGLGQPVSTNPGSPAHAPSTDPDTSHPRRPQDAFHFPRSQYELPAVAPELPE